MNSKIIMRILLQFIRILIIEFFSLFLMLFSIITSPLGVAISIVFIAATSVMTEQIKESIITWLYGISSWVLFSLFW